MHKIEAIIDHNQKIFQQNLNVWHQGIPSRPKASDLETIEFVIKILETDF